MPSAYRQTDRERLAVLAAVVLEHLGPNERYSEGELENDPELANLYNLADAMEDAAKPYPVVGVSPAEQAANRRKRREAEERADAYVAEVLAYAGAGRLEELAQRFAREVGRDG